MRKFIIIISILMLCIAGAAALYFSQISTEKRSSTKILSFIPSDAALIFELNNEQSFYEVFKDYKPFDAILGQQLAHELNQVRSVLLNQLQLKPAIEGQNIFLSLHPNSKTSSIEFLWLLTLDAKADKEDLINFFDHPPSDIRVKKFDTPDLLIYEISLKTLEQTLYIYFENGIAIGSFSKELFTRSLDNKVEKIGESFVNEINNNQRNNSPVNLFVNHKALAPFIRNFTKNKNYLFSFLTSQLEGFSSLNMNFKSDAIMFNGLIKPDTASQSYLNIFLKQNPVKTTINRFLPDNTASYTSFGISNIEQYQLGLRSLFNHRKESDKLQNQLKYVQNQSGTDLERDFKPFLGNEFAVFQLSNQEKLAVIKISNAQKISFVLNQISSIYADDIRRLDYSHLVYYYFGDPLKEFSRPYFSIVDNYLVLSNSSAALQNAVKSYIDEKLLLKTLDYQQFNQLVGNQSNILFFTQYKNSSNIYKAVLKRDYFDVIENKNFGFKNFYGFSYQLSSEGNQFFANVYTNYIAPADKMLEETWKFKMNGRIAISPQIIDDSTGSKLILVQDNVNNLYAVSTDGKKLWSTQLSGKILGSIKQLKDYSIVFNTSNRVYRLTPQGISFPNYPVGLPRNASYGLSITVSDSSPSRILIPCNSQIIGLDTDGNFLSEWNKNLNSKILYDLKTVETENIRYVIAGTTSGQFYFYNYNGNLISSNIKINKQFLNPLEVDQGSNENNTSLVSTDSAGTVHHIFLDGQLTQHSVDNWPSSHYFNYKNVDGDSKQEFIFLNKSQLHVYNSQNSQLYNFQFNSTILQPPLFFTQNGTIYQIGVAAEKENLIYLFNNDGSLVKQFPMNALPAFTVSSLNNDGNSYLLCGKRDNFLYAYKL